MPVFPAENSTIAHLFIVRHALNVLFIVQLFQDRTEDVSDEFVWYIIEVSVF